ncbi:MAG: hypothetical protein FWC64_13295, partial [Treponema sp.]|nr:hypothetical protein [Treponema sp.]
GNEAGSEESETIEYGKKGMLKIKTKDVPDGGFVNVTISCAASGFTMTKPAEVKDNAAELPFDTKSITRQTLEKLGDGDDLVYKFVVETADKRAKADGGEIKVVFTHIQEYTPKIGADRYGDELTLESADGEYKQTHDTSECSFSESGRALIAFTGVLPGKRYSLALERKDGEREPYLLDVPFSKLNFDAEGRL